MNKFPAQFEVKSKEWFLARCAQSPCLIEGKKPDVEIPEHIQNMCTRVDCIHGLDNSLTGACEKIKAPENPVKVAKIRMIL